MKISVTGTQQVVLDNETIRNSTWFLFQGLREFGYEVTADLDGDFLISINHSSQGYRAFLKNGGSKRRAILIRTEPESIYPSQYKKGVFSKYGLIFTPGGIPELQQSKTFVNHPYLYNLNPVLPRHDDPAIERVISAPEFSTRFEFANWQKREILISLVASNKVSPTVSNNYSLRRFHARHHSLSSLEVYGTLWNSNFYSKLRHRLGVLSFSIRNLHFPNFKSIYGDLFRKYPGARGEVTNKHLIIQHSKFSLVIENNNTCITEKIFDAFMGGSIPIYFGPDLNLFGLSERLAIIEKDSTRDPAEIIRSLDSTKILELLENIRDFVTSDIFLGNWTAEGVYGQVLQELKIYIGKN